MEFKKVKRPRPVQPPVHVRPQEVEASPKKRQVVLTKATKRILWIIAAVVTVTIISAIAYSVISEQLASSPSFQAVLPAGKSINELGGWTRVSPPGEPPAFAYSDSIDDVTVRVSEQQLPSGSQSVTEIAKGYNATNKITAGKLTAYIGTSFKGPQSVIFAKNNLLILIGSTATINNNSWVSYITSLE